MTVVAGATVLAAVAMGTTWAVNQRHVESGTSVGVGAEDRAGTVVDAGVTPTPLASRATASASTSISASPSASRSVTASVSAVLGHARQPQKGSTSKPASVPAKSKPAKASTPGAPFASGYNSSLDSQSAVSAALKAAHADGKAVLLDFGANWCGNCKAADKVFSAGGTAGILSDSYHVVKVDIGSSDSDNFSLLRKYSPGSGSYLMPVLIVLSPSGDVRTDTQKVGKPSLTASGLDAFLHEWA
ncbi:thioredoxin family protein [Streptomyces sp. NPDC005529]|uniref:thioredoxin family protein n=1 Tax=unclassified Streptomyces TaxID=2593676 RepID=UPI00339E4009